MKRIVCIFFASLLLTGCAADRTLECRVVTGVQVQYQMPEGQLTRVYTRQESIQSVLNYLRMLEPTGVATPQQETDFTCRFTVHYSHGADTVYFQQGCHCLRREDEGWKEINDAQARLLYPLLLLLPSDQ